jgi:hypothetical protein
VNVGTGALYELRSEEEAAAAQRAMQANYAELTKLSAELREREQEPSEDLRELVAARVGRGGADRQAGHPGARAQAQAVQGGPGRAQA